MTDKKLIATPRITPRIVDQRTYKKGYEDALWEMQKCQQYPRPWGYYEILGKGPGYLVKRITVKPGQRTSLQWHEKRIENWEVMLGDKWNIETQWRMKKGPDKPTVTDPEQVWTHIDMREVHRIHNTGKKPLVIIEIQRFDADNPSNEDDIHRIEDDYNRCENRLQTVKRD